MTFGMEGTTEGGGGLSKSRTGVVEDHMRDLSIDERFKLGMTGKHFFCPFGAKVVLNKSTKWEKCLWGEERQTCVGH